MPTFSYLFVTRCDIYRCDICGLSFLYIFFLLLYTTIISFDFSIIPLEIHISQLKGMPGVPPYSALSL